jgi:hypothetical protein
VRRGRHEDLHNAAEPVLRRDRHLRSGERRLQLRAEELRRDLRRRQSLHLQ